MNARAAAILFAIAAVLAAIAAVTGLRTGDTGTERGPASGGIVSLSPSVTEVLFALGLGDRVSGVTTFCDYPAEAKVRTKIGGYYDPKYETIVGLAPALAITLPEQDKVREDLEKLGIRVLSVDHRTVERILDSVGTIAGACGAEARGAELRADMERQLAALRTRTSAIQRRPRVLVSVGRQMGAGTIRELYVCGRGTYFDQLLTLAGGVNATDVEHSYPSLSPESVISLKPDLILEIAPDLEQRELQISAIEAEWHAVPGLESVLVRVLSGDHIAVPGPRFIQTAGDMATAVAEAAAR